MAGTAPIKLGSALGSYLTFESSSNVTTSASGIQSVSVKALWADGSTVWNKIPAAGTSFSTVFGHAYLPSDFKVDRSKDGTIDVEYLDGRIARVTFEFKRPDPSQPANSSGQAGRQVFIDSVFNYAIVAGTGGNLPVTTASGQQGQTGLFGFAEPTATVKYNTSTPPALGSGNLSSLYAAYGSPQAQGFPTLLPVVLPVNVSLSQPQIDGLGGSFSFTYLDGSGTLVSTVETSPFSLRYTMSFNPHPYGWQLTKLKYDPVAGATTYDVEEDYRNFYFVTGFQFVALTHP